MTENDNKIKAHNSINQEMYAQINKFLEELIESILIEREKSVLE